MRLPRCRRWSPSDEWRWMSLSTLPSLQFGIHLLKAYYKALMSLKSTGGSAGRRPPPLSGASKTHPPCNQGKKSVSLYGTSMLRRTGVVPDYPKGPQIKSKNGGTDGESFISVSGDPRARPVERGARICPGHGQRHNPGNGDRSIASGGAWSRGGHHHQSDRRKTHGGHQRRGRLPLRSAFRRCVLGEGVQSGIRLADPERRFARGADGHGQRD